MEKVFTTVNVVWLETFKLGSLGLQANEVQYGMFARF